MINLYADLFVEDDVGTFRCSGCHRSTTEVDQVGHAGSCPYRELLDASMPKGAWRRRVVGEWPGLYVAIVQDHDLRHNLVSVILQSYRDDYRRAQQRRAGRTLEPRAAMGKALAELETLLEELAPRFRRLETVGLQVLGWWGVGDRLDGVGGPPRRRKRR